MCVCVVNLRGMRPLADSLLRAVGGPRHSGRARRQNTPARRLRRAVIPTVLPCVCSARVFIFCFFFFISSFLHLKVFIFPPLFASAGHMAGAKETDGGGGGRGRIYTVDPECVQSPRRVFFLFFSLALRRQEVQRQWR